MDTMLRRSLPLLALPILLSACGDDVKVVAQQAAMSIDPKQYDIGDVQILTERSVQIFVRNTGDGALRIAGVVPVGSFSEDVFSFNIDRMVLTAGGVGVISVAFTPRDLAAYELRLEVRPEDGQGVEPQTITVTGRGVTAGLTVTPNPISFGNVVLNTSKTIQVQVANSSNIPAKVEYVPGNNIRLCSEATDGSTYCARLLGRAFAADRTFTLNANETAAFEIEFTPNVAGLTERSALVLKACETSACEISVPITGVGVDSGFRCEPATIDFNRVNPGSCLTRNVVCTNIANEQVTVISWSMEPIQGGAPVTDFEAEDSTVHVLNENDSVDVDVTYCPNDLGEDRGNLVLETDNRNPAQRNVLVPVRGTGGGPDIEVLPAQINFGLVSLIAPARRTLLISNAGESTLQINEIIADGAGTGAFTAPGASADAIEPGESRVITVEFQPVAEGAVESYVLIRSSDVDEPEVRVRVLGEGINLPPCSFEVSPAQLSFGVVERTRTVLRAFEIRNTGANDCLITSARLAPGSDAEFSLPGGDIVSRIVPPNSAAAVQVQFAPTTSNTSTGQIEFSISSPTSPFNTVALSGTGADATLLIVPNDLDFGTIGVGCRARARSITMYNTGSTPARIDSIAITPPNTTAFTLTNLPGLPVTLAPGGNATFDVGFRADTVSDYAAAVEISGTFAGAPVTYIVSLQGRGDLDATQVDEFEQLGTPKVDILFVIDNSCSMFEEQTSLSSNFAAFVRFAENQAIDYQLAVTTTDVDGGENGRFVPVAGLPSNRIVTPQTQPTPEAVFVQNTVLGTNGSASEKGLEAAYQALTAPNIVQHNAGFLRQDAVLSIIVVSDEEDSSPQTVDFYANFFLSIKGFRNTNLFSFSSIVGDAPSGCNGSGGNAGVGGRYIEVTNRTGGVFQSICVSDWARALEELSSTAFGFKSRFFLSNQPVISTIVVYIDGNQFPATSSGGGVQWNYDFATNSINFGASSIPEPGVQIRVEYTAECL